MNKLFKMKLLCLVFLCFGPMFGAPEFRSDSYFYEEINEWLKLHEVPEDWQRARPTCQPEGAQEFRSDYDFYQELNGWLKLHEVPEDWQEARLTCQFEGSILASPNDEKFLKVIKRLMSNNSGDTPRSIYTGIHSTFASGQFFTVDGISLERIPVTWAPDEPNNQNGEEQCLILHPNGTMADVPCASVYPFLCYKAYTKDMPQINECGTIDNEYKYSNLTSTCHKFHTVPRNWNHAFKTCAAEGGYLAIINSPGEADLLNSIHLEKLSQVTVMPNYLKHVDEDYFRRIAFVGFRYWQQHGTWTTIHGQTLKEAGYDHWARGEPNNRRSPDNKFEGEQCGAIDSGYPDVGLNDLWCKHAIAFFCEKAPPASDERLENGFSTDSPSFLNTIDTDR